MKFFLGIRLPRELEDTYERYRRAFKAPQTVSHITVIAPFTWERTLEDLLETLKMNLADTQPFAVKGAGIGSFGTRVIFVNVTLTPELAALQKALTAGLDKEGISVDRRSYNPHITLATRLSAKQFSVYTAKVRDFCPGYAFTCTSLSLFKFTDVGRWDECHRILLG